MLTITKEDICTHPVQITDPSGKTICADCGKVLKKGK